MRDSRPVPSARLAASDAFAPATAESYDGMNAMRMLTSAANVGGSRVASGPMAAPATDPAADSRVDSNDINSGQPLHRTTVTGAAGGRAGNHVGGAMLPPAANMVALSDGTRISFGAVAEAPEFEVA
jgi:hypothetical protein